MPIEVRHDASSPELDAALALLLSQTQPEQSQAPPQDAARALLDQLTPMVRPSTPQPVDAISGAPIPTYGTDSQQPRVQYPRYSIGGGRVGGSTNAYDRLANQDWLAQYRADQQAARQEDRQQQQAAIESQQAADTMSRQLAHDPPDWIQQGLSAGSLKYSPAQLRERQQLQDSIDQVYSDPSWSPDQRARFEARQRERIRQIDLSPQQVPWNERPVPPDQQYQQSLIMRPVQIDENTTLNLPVIPHMRNGQVEYRLAPEGQAAFDLARDKLKHQQAMEQKQIDDARKQAEQQKRDAAKAEADRQREINQLTVRKDRLTTQRHKALQDLQQAVNLREKINGGQAPLDKSGNPIPESEALAAINQAQSRLYDLQVELSGISSQMYSLGHQPGDTGLPQESPSNQSEGGLIDIGGGDVSGGGASASAPAYDDATGRVIVDSEAQAQQYGLKDGTPIVDSNGRTGVYRSQ